MSLSRLLCEGVICSGQTGLGWSRHSLYLDSRRDGRGRVFHRWTVKRWDSEDIRGRTLSRAKHVGLKTKQQRQTRLQNFINVMKEKKQKTFKTQCTGRFVQLLFAAVSLVFLPVSQNEGFSGWPSWQMYSLTQRQGSGGPSPTPLIQENSTGRFAVNLN